MPFRFTGQLKSLEGGSDVKLRLFYGADPEFYNLYPVSMKGSLRESQRTFAGRLPEDFININIRGYVQLLFPIGSVFQLVVKEQKFNCVRLVTYILTAPDAALGLDEITGFKFQVL